MKDKNIAKIGLFGGTFDPIHLGHLLTAEFVREVIGLEKIIFIPSYIHPLKDNQLIEASYHRLNMLQLALKDNPSFIVSDIELQQEKMSYTLDTIKKIQEKYPLDNNKLYFLLGIDNVNQLHLWKEPEILLQICQLIAFGRPRITMAPEVKSYLSKVQFVETPLLDISSTAIREQVSQKRSIRYLVPDSVANYIKEHSLYCQK